MKKLLLTLATVFMAVCSYAQTEIELTLTEGHTLLVSTIEEAGGKDTDIIRFYINNTSGESRNGWGIGGFAESDNWGATTPWKGQEGESWVMEYTVAEIKSVAKAGQYHDVGITINIYNGCKVGKCTLYKPIKYQKEGKDIPFDQWGNILSSAFNGFSNDARIEFCYTSTGSEGYVGWGPGSLSSLKGTSVPGAGSKMNIKNEGENKFTYTLEDLKPYLDDEPNAYNQYGLNWNLWGFSDGKCTNTRKSITIYEVEGFEGKGYRSPDSEDRGDEDVPAVNAVELTILDIQAAANPSKAFSGKLEGAEKVELNKDEKVAKIATVTDFDGNVIAKVPFTLDGMKVSFTYEDGINRGDYVLTFAENVFSVDEELYDKPLSCILAVGKKDEAAQKAYEEDFANEIETASYIKESLIYGVNLYQYAPGLKKKIQAAIDEAEYYGELLVEEEHIYNIIAKLRMYMKSLRPILPQTDKEYCIKHKPTGLYLNISGDKVILSENPTPVQFHLTEPSEGPWCWMNNHWTYGYFDEVYYTSHAAYIYTTPERKYLGYNIEEKEVGEGDDKYTYKAPVSTNKKNTVWYIDVNHTNNYEIYIAYDYNNNGGYYDWLYAPSDAEEGADVTCDDKMIGYGDDELVEITPIIDNGNIVITPNNPLPGQVVKPIEDQIPGYIWFIEDYIAPEVTETTPEVTESTEEATAISAVEAAANATAIFNAAGARTNTLQKGMNIVKMANGQVKKVFIK